MIIRKSPEEIEKMAAAGRVVADTIALLGEHMRPGVTTGELDRLAAEYIAWQGGTSPFYG
jgi:methionyl aminopeptidase